MNSRSYTDADGRHYHAEATESLTLEELLALSYIPGGEIRHTYQGEIVALNNLVAALGRFSVDLSGNRHGAYFILPESFAVRCIEDWQSRGYDPTHLPRTPDGGVMGMIAKTTLYSYSGDLVLMRSDYNGACWSLQVTARHELLRRSQIKDLLGPGRGFDDRVYYLPDSRWGWLGYTPVPLLATWAEEGDAKAAETLTNMSMEVPRASLAEVAVDALERLQLPVPEGARDRIQRLRLREAARQEGDHKLLT